MSGRELWVDELDRQVKTAKRLCPELFRESASSSPGKESVTISLDNYLQISTRIKKEKKPFNKKQKRIFACALTGINRMLSLGRDVWFLTLTTSPKAYMRDIAKDWDLLVKYIRRYFHFDFHYVKVETSEGNGVIHALFHSAFDDGFDVEVYDEKKGCFVKSDCLDAVHAFFSAMWERIHFSPVVWVTKVGVPYYSKKKHRWFCNSKKRVASYLAQYTSGQDGYLRMSQSFGWIFRGWRKKFLGLIKRLGFKFGLQAWRFLISDSSASFNKQFSVCSVNHNKNV